MTCIICQAPMPAAWTEYPEYPFCSKRCKLIDLGRWLNEDYKVAAPPDPGDDENRSTPAGDGDPD